MAKSAFQETTHVMATQTSTPSLNGEFLEALYDAWAASPTSVDPSWAAYFAAYPETFPPHIGGPSWTPKPVPHAPAPKAPSQAPTDEEARHLLWGSIRALRLIRAYRTRGHFAANLDPLGIEGGRTHPELDPAFYGFTPEDMDQTFVLDGSLGLESATLREILGILKRTYADTIGVEFTHIQNPEEKHWIQMRCEARHAALSAQEKKDALLSLTRAEGFERFLAIKYPGAKRFGLEGGESLIPALEALFETSASLGVREGVLGMPHRGRLNVLTNILGKAPRVIFSEFQGKSATPEDVQGSGDVKYHLGASAERSFGGQTLKLSLTANPSHLEAVNPVVMGKVRAKQEQRGDKERKEVMGVLLHGDAAFAGQGLVAETLLLSDLVGYRTGGTVHFIVNNQIGFTTSPNKSRSSPYSSDVAKMVQAPVFHVNGDDVEAVLWVARLAAEYRQTFHNDVVIDMFCYRRHGHNEMDEPSFTQPLMYAAIAQKPTTRTLYAGALVSQGVVTSEEAQQVLDANHAALQSEFDAASSFVSSKADWLEGVWSGITQKWPDGTEPETGLSLEALRTLGKELVTIPSDFALNDKLTRLFKTKEQMFDSGEGFDWATGEALAFGGLLKEGFTVRLSGQDSGRGTFSHRHAVLVDQKTDETYVPLAHLPGAKGHIEIVDSPLAEASVLGFELGYTLADPQALVMWEAQFGDFANGAQVIFDQFIAAGEAKWLRLSGLVMLLPHGYEGQGPEHSSARLERYLQACAQDNLIVANCSTPASYYHILRRQLHRPVRKPLIIMTPKSLLRDKRAASTLADFGPGTTFQPIIPDPRMAKITPSKVKRIIICSGKVYYEIMDALAANKSDDIMVLRQEQFYPYPEALLTKLLAPFKAAEVVWCQEEPENMGAWHFIDRRLEKVLIQAGFKNPRPRYIGRPEAAATAAGLLSRHKTEEERFLQEATRLS